MRGFGCAFFVMWRRIKMGFPENLKAARKELKLTQQDVADALGVCRTAIAHYENGTTLPYTKSIDKLCEILNLTYEELFKP